jgi:drug/metabolite transporter (DMT)-like permease
MKEGTIKSDIMLLITAVIWGFGFVAQRVGMEYVGPFAFNGARFALGCMVLLPFIIWRSRKLNKLDVVRVSSRSLIPGGCLAGIVLFAGASFQQVGLVYTTAGNAGFITGLYVVVVPFVGSFIGRKPNTGTWIGAFLATAGLYLLSVKVDFTIAYGDLLVLAGAFMWAIHVLIIDRLSPKNSALKIAFIQFAVCSALSFITAFLTETVHADSLIDAAVPILYGGCISVGIAYTLQVVAQKDAHPAHASILLSLEAFFAAVGGWIILNEILTPREMTGCALMLFGMLLSQLWGYFRSHQV